MAQEETKEGITEGNTSGQGAEEVAPTQAQPVSEPAQPTSTTPAQASDPESVPADAAPADRPDTPETSEPRAKKELPDERTLISQVLQGLVNRIGIRSRVEVVREDDHYYANIKTRHSNGLLIGRRGATLRAIQYLTRLIVKQDYPEVPAITVDVSGYRQRRENFLRKKATAVARIVSETHREMALDFLSEKEMEVVEDALKPMPNIRVYAVGTGTRKNVIIAPTHQ
ncbi:MAG: KH domain-containing protein [candidate division WOR-3 bacterium]|nr:MAG: KH domain-containing protein [candidate division WOR-3 bacterium]